MGGSKEYIKMRLKVSIEYIQSTDPSDFRKNSIRAIEEYIRDSILSDIKEYSGGANYFTGFTDSLVYAYRDDNISVKVEHLDDEF